MLSPFDALVDAVVQYSGYRTPGSPTNVARNPGGLRVHGNGDLRVFKSDIDGMQALKFDMRLKIAGRAKSKPTTLTELAESFHQSATLARTWALYLRQALSDQSIAPKSPLSMFMETK